jgi:lambda repressor-like predicted transcriptional regulator
MRLSRNLAGASSALSSRSNLPTHRKQPAPSGCSLAARGLSRRASGWDFLDIWAGACLRRGRKVNGRWTEGGQRTPVSMSSSKRSPRPGPTAVQRVLSGFSAGSRKVLRRCLICRLDRKCLDLDPFPSGACEATLVGRRDSADSDSGRARGVSPIHEFGGFALNDERLRPVIGRGGLVVVLKRDQVLTACAARGLSLEELRLAAGISRPTLQAALRGKRVRPRTALKLARALNRHPVLEEIGLLLEAS